MTEPLPCESLGDGTDIVVFAHGFTQTRSAWRPVATELVRLSTNVRCVLVDLPGHGDAGTRDSDLHEAASALVATAGRAHYVGYSLGARVVLAAALHHSAVVRSVVSVSGTAGIEDADERERRRRSDAQLAERIIDVGVDAFLDEWLAQPLFADLPHDRALIDDRRVNTARGLASSLARCGQGAVAPMWNELATCTTPLLAIAGTRDQKFTSLARRMATIAPRGALALINGAGHSVHLEQPEAVARELSYWINTPKE